MPRDIFAAFAAIIVLASFAFAQVPGVTPEPNAKNAPIAGFGLPPGHTVTDPEGDKVENTGNGKVRIELGRGTRGTFRQVGATEWAASLSISRIVLNRGGQGIKTEGPMDIELRDSTTSAEVHDNARGEAAKVEVKADNTTVDAYGTDMEINVDDGADNGTINCKSGSSGTITYGNSGPGTVNVDPGAGRWQISGR
tara:strand:+ start:907 stop:1494 length:588 start_codon:yes stop_codon:yes gene_type:complete